MPARTICSLVIRIPFPERCGLEEDLRAPDAENMLPRTSDGPTDGQTNERNRDESAAEKREALPLRSRAVSDLSFLRLNQSASEEGGGGEAKEGTTCQLAVRPSISLTSASRILLPG